MIVSENMGHLFGWHCRHCCAYVVTCVYCLCEFGRFEDGPPNMMLWCAIGSVRQHFDSKLCLSPYFPGKPAMNELGLHTMEQCYYVGCVREHFLMSSPFGDTPFSPRLHEETHNTD